jgi:protein gp37
MGKDSKIEWTDHTVNLWWGCDEVHAGCDNCYAKVLSHRYLNDLWGKEKGRKRIISAFKDLNKYQKLAKAANTFHRVFMGSMHDIFEKSMKLINPVDHYTETDDLRQELFTRINAGFYQNLILLFLTKRPSNIAKMVPAGWINEAPRNIMFGTSVSDQMTFDTLVPQLLKTVNGKLFLSIEPQLGPISTSGLITKFKHLGGAHRINWIIQGGESGHHKRPFDIEWARSMKSQCDALDIPYFFKQIDKIQEIPEDLMIRQFP